MLLDGLTIAAGSFIAGVVAKLGGFCIAAAAIWKELGK